MMTVYWDSVNVFDIEPSIFYSIQLSLRYGYLHIVAASGLMLLKDWMKLVVQLVARQNLSFLSTTLLSFSR